MTHSERCTCGAEFSVDATFMGTTAASREMAEFRNRHARCLVAWRKRQAQGDSDAESNPGIRTRGPLPGEPSF